MVISVSCKKLYLLSFLVIDESLAQDEVGIGAGFPENQAMRVGPEVKAKTYPVWTTAKAFLARS